MAGYATYTENRGAVGALAGDRSESPSRQAARDQQFILLCLGLLLAGTVAGKRRCGAWYASFCQIPPHVCGGLQLASAATRNPAGFAVASSTATSWESKGATGLSDNQPVLVHPACRARSVARPSTLYAGTAFFPATSRTCSWKGASVGELSLSSQAGVPKPTGAGYHKHGGGALLPTLKGLGLPAPITVSILRRICSGRLREVIGAVYHTDG